MTVGCVVLLLAKNHYFIPVVHWGIYLIIIIGLYTFAVVLGCIKISLSFFLPVYCNAKTQEKVVALSFDDGPDDKYTPLILEILKKYNVPATFFCIGKHIKGNEQLIKRMHDEGHAIGNHSYTHNFWFDVYSTKSMLAEMKYTDDDIKAIIGQKPLLFRPPYGVTNPNLSKAIKIGGYSPIGWSIRSMDTIAKNERKLLEGITEKINPGDIILLHDNISITASILSSLIEKIQQRGYRIIRLDKMLKLEVYV
ncbi:MAG: polysaccharide deacetylase family protein [Taibaiella sp.]|nr:polysaccharide deacetylase family protein [Taibaiella sp.]